MIDNSLGDAEYYDRSDYAGYGTRLIILLIDSLVLIFTGIVLLVPFALFAMSGTTEDDPSGYFWLLYLPTVWAYLVPLKRSEFGTVGFKLLGVKLVTTKGGRPSLFSMTVRTMMWIIGGPFNLVMDLLWLGADSERQSLRDCYLGTYLIRRSAVPAGRAPVRLTHYNAMGFTLCYPRVCRPTVGA